MTVSINDVSRYAAYTGFTEEEKHRYDQYSNQAMVWLNEMRQGRLTTDGIKQAVWASAENQNIYMESLEMRMRQMEDDPPSDANRITFYNLQQEIYDVRASNGDAPWLASFNDELTKYMARAQTGEDDNYISPQP